MPAKYSYADALYPDQASPEARKAMDEDVRKGKKRKKSPTQRKKDYTDDHVARGASSPLGGVAKRSLEEPTTVRNRRVVR
jgi:hypothetical protein